MAPSAQPSTASGNAERVTRAIDRIMRPVIRLFVGRISCDFLLHQIKRIYIEEARTWIAKSDVNARITKSKLAMLTGLDTRTISSIESANGSGKTDSSDLCAETSVLYMWISRDEFLRPNKQPAVLPIAGKSGTFQSLVGRAVGRNVTYQTVLERLTESGNIEFRDENHVELVNSYYQPIKNSEQTIIDAGSASVGRLATTVLHNLSMDDRIESRLQQDRWSRRVPQEKIEELNSQVRKLISCHILEVEALIESYERPEPDATTGNFGVGWFIFE